MPVEPSQAGRGGRGLARRARPTQAAARALARRRRPSRSPGPGRQASARAAPPFRRGGPASAPPLRRAARSAGSAQTHGAARHPRRRGGPAVAARNPEPSGTVPCVFGHYGRVLLRWEGHFRTGSFRPQNGPFRGNATGGGNVLWCSAQFSGTVVTVDEIKARATSVARGSVDIEDLVASGGRGA